MAYVVSNGEGLAWSRLEGKRGIPGPVFLPIFSSPEDAWFFIKNHLVNSHEWKPIKADGFVIGTQSKLIKTPT